VHESHRVLSRVQPESEETLALVEPDELGDIGWGKRQGRGRGSLFDGWDDGSHESSRKVEIGSAASFATSGMDASHLVRMIDSIVVQSGRNDPVTSPGVSRV
jgi:hypothetical protein